MINWVIIVVIITALIIFIKTTGFRYGNFMTYLIASLLIFFVITFVYATSISGANLSTYEGFLDGIGYYFSWLANFFQTTAGITGHAINTYSNNITGRPR